MCVKKNTLAESHIPDNNYSHCHFSLNQITVMKFLCTELLFQWLKKESKILVLLLCLTSGVFAQDFTEDLMGIYLSREDFILNKISHLQRIDSVHYLQKDFNGNVLLNSNGVVTKFAHDDIFGYHYEASKYLAYGKKENWLSPSGYLKIEDEGTLVVYSQKGGHFKTAHSTFYYFNRSIDLPVKRLTIKNLKNEFPQNPNLISSFKKHRTSLTKRKGNHLVVNNIIKSES